MYFGEPISKGLKGFKASLFSIATILTKTVIGLINDAFFFLTNEQLDFKGLTR